MKKQVIIIIPRRWWQWKEKVYTREIAVSWQEMTHEMRLFSLKTLLNFEATEAKMNIVNQLLDLPKTVFLNLSDVQMATLIGYYDWLHLGAAFVPIIEGFFYKGSWFRLPKAKFADGKGIEFPMADRFLSDFQQSGDYKDLLKIVGTLARPKHKGKRVPLWSVEEAEKRAEYFADLPIETATAVLLYFVGVKKYIFETYDKWLFEEVESQTKEAAAHFPNFGWWGTYLGIAETGTFGDYKTVLQTNFHRICMYLIEKRRIQEASKPKPNE
jgi:hypothetical protein